MSFNHVQIKGRLTDDPELRYTSQKDTAISEFSLAVDDDYDDDRTHFFDVTAWAGTAEIVAEYLKKGSPVLVSGSLTQDRWQTDDGQNRSQVKVTADEVEFLGQPSSNKDRNPGGPADDVEVYEGPDDVPF